MRREQQTDRFLKDDFNRDKLTRERNNINCQEKNQHDQMHLSENGGRNGIFP